jgi:hypothetical protein
VKGITDIAQSDKRPEEGIGNKGIGFKSVLQLTRAPQIYSVADASAKQRVDGYCFTFADQDLLSDILGGESELLADVVREVFHLCLPVPLTETPNLVATLVRDGYVTVVRLPLKSEEARSDAVKQLQALAGQPPTLLFLHRISLLVLEQIRAGELERRELPRIQTSLATVGRMTLATVDLGDAGIFLVADKPVAQTAFMAAIERSVVGDHISDGWRDWAGEARVGVAVPVEMSSIRASCTPICPWASRPGLRCPLT